MSSLKEIWDNYKGAILGIIIAIIIRATKMYDLIITIILLVLGAIVGNYIQQNKQIVKDRIKNFIDRF